MNIIKTLKEILYPRLTTREMESSQTRCGCDFQITSMFFEDSNPDFPVKTVGCINTGQGMKIIVSWNQNGECMISGSRIKSFDLVTAQRLKNEGRIPYRQIGRKVMFDSVEILKSMEQGKKKNR